MAGSDPATEPIPDVSVGQNWAVRRLPTEQHLPPGCPREVAIIETEGPVYLTEKAARHLARLLLAYAEGETSAV